MPKTRLEAFSDGVYAIIITIMVLELEVPDNPTLDSYLEKYHIFISYALSFLLIGLHWLSHHNMFHRAEKVNNNVLWANMFGLFWLSLVPFTTGAMGENEFTSITVSIYAINLILCVVSYMVLVRQLRLLHGLDSEFSKRYKGNARNYLTIVLNAAAAVVALSGLPKIAFLLLAAISLMWFIPNSKFGSAKD